MTELVGGLWLVAGLGTVTAAATLATSCLRLRSALEFVLSVYAIGWLWVVVVLLGLSPPSLVTRGWFVAGLLTGFVAALIAWNVCDRPRPPSFRSALSALSPKAIHPAVLVLGVAVALGLGYSVALALLTPVNEGDSLSYHLARAAFWKQEQQIGYVPGAFDLRLDVNPPNAEIGQLATMLLAGGDRYVALPQLLAYVALVLGVAAIARRVGFDPSEALFGALVFACLPVVVVQSSGALNDLVVASFLVTSALFAIGHGRRTLVVFAIAVALALGAKVTAVLALPTLMLVATVGRPRREWLMVAVAGMAGLIAGCVWYAVNLLETGAVDGGLSEDAEQRVELSLAAIAVNVLRYGLDLLDMSGTPGSVSVLFLVIAAGAAFAIPVCWRRSRGLGMALVGTSALSLIVFATPVLAELGREVVFRSWIVLGRPPTPPFERGFALNVVADPVDSWYGPLGLMLLAVGVVVLLPAWGRGRVPLTALVLSLAPWTLLLTVASVVVWDPWRGRFLAFGVALAAATWGLLLRWRVTAFAVPVITVVGLALALVNYQGKPSGLGPLLGVESQFGVPVRSIWGSERVEAIARVRGDGDEEAVLRFVERDVPAGASIAIAPRTNDYLFPYFGMRMKRSVTLLRPSSVVPTGAEWLVLSPRARVQRCTDAWQRELALETGWRIERRVGPDGCDAAPVASGPG